MEKTKINIKEEILRNKIQSIRLLFCDIEGNLKGIEYSTNFISRILEDEISIAMGIDVKEIESQIHTKLEPPGSTPKVKHIIDEFDDEDDDLMNDVSDSSGKENKDRDDDDEEDDSDSSDNNEADDDFDGDDDDF